jgi:ElaB/YqjD/DUF883 family membrane-anchored ribosome-binding protein
MDQERSEVRAVEEARERVTQDVRSVAYNADIVDRAKENVQGRIDDMKGTVTDTVSDMRDRVNDVRDAVQDRMQSVARNIPLPGDNPIGMLFAGLAVGFLVGLILPVTRFESERLRPVADEMKDRVRQARSEVVKRGGEVLKDTIDAAKETATNSLLEQSRDLGVVQNNE